MAFRAGDGIRLGRLFLFVEISTAGEDGFPLVRKVRVEVCCADERKRTRSGGEESDGREAGGTREA